MAHFAKIDPNSLVEDIVFVDNSITHEKYADDTEVEKEERGVEYLKGIFGSDTIWKQCSFNTWSNKHKLSGTPFRFNMPEIGYTYDSLRDGFIPPKPGNDYILIEKKLQWTSMADWTSQYKEQVKTFRNDI
jgi:hypothetical protein